MTSPSDDLQSREIELPDSAAPVTLAGRYRLDHVLGRGGMGVVYRGHDVRLDRAVAVKVLAERPLGENARARLLREARIAAGLNHPHIVSVYDAGEDQGRPYVVMELVTGPSLRHYRPHSLHEVRGFALQLAEALQYAHDQGIVHRDVKPENLLITPGKPISSVKLADLGLALPRESSRVTRDGYFVGTPPYLAPEQALGKRVDGRADLYSLGVVMYELVAGRTPFVGNALEVISQHIHAPVVPPRAHNPDLPVEFEEIVLRLLAKEPDRRFADANALAAVLRQGTPTAIEVQVEPSVRALDELVRGRLVGRMEALETLRGLWRQVLDGSSHLALVSGEPGSGKTRLVGEILVQARLRGARVLEGGSYEYEATTPYLPFVEAIGRWVRAASDDDLAALQPSMVVELARLAPELASRVPADHAAPRLAPAEERLRLFDHVTRFFQHLARDKGMVLFLDDMQWVDQGSLSLLHFLLRQTRTDRLLVLAAYRDTDLERSSEVARALTDWHRERLATRIRLPRLDRQETEALLATLLGSSTMPRGFVDAVFTETDGNPFFIEEVLKALIERGQVERKDGSWIYRRTEDLVIPQSIKMAIGQRLERIGTKCNEVLHTASVLGRVFGFTELLEVSGLEENVLLDALEEAERAQLIAPASGEAFHFTHDMIREVLYEEINIVRRRRIHLKVGQGLERMRESGRSIGVSDLAHHFIGGGDNERGLRYSQEAATAAERMFAHGEALQSYRQALECAEALENHDVLSELHAARAEVWVLTGDFPSAIDEQERAVAHATDDEERYVRQSRLGEMCAIIGDPRGFEVIQDLLSKVDPDQQPLPTARALSVAARFHHNAGHYGRAVTLLERALGIAERVGDPPTIGWTSAFLAGSLLHQGRFDESDLYSSRCVLLPQDLLRAIGHEFLAETAYLRGEWEQALGALRSELEVAERGHLGERIAWVRACEGVIFHGQGKLADALRALDASVAQAQRIQQDRLAVLAGAWRVLVLADLSRLDEGLRSAESLVEQADESGQLFLRAEALRGLGAVQVRRGDWEQALTVGAHLDLLLEDTETVMTHLGWSGLHAEAMLHSGDLEGATDRAEAFLALAERVGSKSSRGVALRVRAEVRLARYDFDRADADIQESLAVHERLGSRLEWARAAEIAARSAKLGGDLQAAATWRARARERLAECGAQPEADGTVSG